MFFVLRTGHAQHNLLYQYCYGRIIHVSSQCLESALGHQRESTAQTGGEAQPGAIASSGHTGAYATTRYECSCICTSLPCTFPVSEALLLVQCSIHLIYLITQSASGTCNCGVNIAPVMLMHRPSTPTCFWHLQLWSSLALCC